MSYKCQELFFVLLYLTLEKDRVLSYIVNINLCQTLSYISKDPGFVLHCQQKYFVLLCLTLEQKQKNWEWFYPLPKSMKNNSNQFYLMRMNPCRVAFAA